MRMVTERQRMCSTTHRAGRDIIGPAYYDEKGDMTPCDQPLVGTDVTKPYLSLFLGLVETRRGLKPR
jgi:hypothetical protein